MSILVTGGAGYIGSHVVVELLNKGEKVVILDNFCNSERSTADRIRQITNKNVLDYLVDITDARAVDRIFALHGFECVIHFAALKAVGESVQNPFAYYHNNVAGMLVLLKAMQKYNVKQLVFSSSATVYGIQDSNPIYETADRSAISPYGQTKIMCENIISDLAKADPKFSAISLRYFNPVGAHSSYLIGENPKGAPNNLMPIIANVATKKTQKMSVYGNDYDTFDGTCIRDYIHVVDLAVGHIHALEYIRCHKGMTSVNLGTGSGVSVLQAIETFESVNDVRVPYDVIDRRKGDSAVLVANVDKAKHILNWQAKIDFNTMCRDQYGWATRCNKV
ncbi:MAG: UDP-glucose 4-epimerase GalE [Clostridiales bacterium]|nr:UDP-glucose 4-epimerase GalE [Clostridiales bacterium]